MPANLTGEETLVYPGDGASCRRPVRFTVQSPLISGFLNLTPEGVKQRFLTGANHDMNVVHNCCIMRI